MKEASFGHANKSEVIDWDEIYTLKPNFPIFTAKKQRKTSDYEQEKVITNRRIDSTTIFTLAGYSYMVHGVFKAPEIPKDIGT